MTGFGARRLTRLFGLTALIGWLLAGCASERQSSHNPFDPWGPHVREASARFDIPEEWIRAVMDKESGGQTHFWDGRPMISRAGAMGLMQVMPGTWEELRVRYDLGNDPMDPRDNIMAGTAYIREMYDQFGTPGFLAAYNAGPARYQAYVEGRRELPEETREYMAYISTQIAGVYPSGRGPDSNWQYASRPATPANVAAPPPVIVAAATPNVDVIPIAPPPGAAVAAILPPPTVPRPADPLAAIIASSAVPDSAAPLPSAVPARPAAAASFDVATAAPVPPPPRRQPAPIAPAVLPVAAPGAPVIQSNGLPAGWYIPTAPGG